MSKKWLGLDDLIGRMRKLVIAALPPDRHVMSKDETSNKAAIVAEQYLGPGYVHGMINVCALALTSNAQPNTWLCRPSASRVVHGTDLHAIPDLPPRVLRGPGVIEARRPETGERLWSDVASLGWYSFGDQFWLLGLKYPDGLIVAHWRPQWTGEELDGQLPGVDDTVLVRDDQRTAYQEFAVAAARYLIVFGLLAESDPSPLRIVLDKTDKAKKRRDVYFDDRQPAPRPRNENPVPLLEGRINAVVGVTGHLKRQRYGEGNAKTKWIYREGYVSRRWVSPRWLVAQLGTGEID